MENSQIIKELRAKNEKLVGVLQKLHDDVDYQFWHSRPWLEDLGEENIVQV